MMVAGGFRSACTARPPGQIQAMQEQLECTAAPVPAAMPRNPQGRGASSYGISGSGSNFRTPLRSRHRSDGPNARALIHDATLCLAGGAELRP